MKKIIIIGAGAMGSAFAVPCIDNKNDVTIVGTHLEDDLIENINSNEHLHPALKIKLPIEIKFLYYSRTITLFPEIDCFAFLKFTFFFQNLTPLAFHQT